MHQISYGGLIIPELLVDNDWTGLYILHAQACQLSGNLELAISLIEQVLEPHGGLPHGAEADHVKLWRLLCRLYVESGRLQKAITTLENLVPQVQSSLPRQHEQIIGLKSDLIHYYQPAKRKEDAITISDEVLGEEDGHFNVSDTQQVTAWIEFAHSLRHCGRAEDGLRLLENISSDMSLQLVGRHPEWSAVQAEIARTYAANGRVT